VPESLTATSTLPDSTSLVLIRNSRDPSLTSLIASTAADSGGRLTIVQSIDLWRRKEVRVTLSRSSSRPEKCARRGTQ